MEENLIERLKELGYSQEQSIQLFYMYERNCDINALLDYIALKESIDESLSEIL